MPLVYAIALYLLCYALLIAEFFVPSGGLLGAGAAAAAIASIVIALTHSTSAGLWMGGLFLVTTPVVLFAIVRVWPKTSIGRRILNRQPGQLAPPNRPRTTPRGTPLLDLVGHSGIAHTDLLPAGLIVIDGEKLDAVSVGLPIDRGTPVVVVSLQGNRIRVRPAREDEVQEQPAEPQRPESPEALESFDWDGLQ